MSVTKDFHLWIASVRERQMRDSSMGRHNLAVTEILMMMESLRYKPTGYMLQPNALLYKKEPPKVVYSSDAVSLTPKSIILKAEKYNFDTTSELAKFDPDGPYYLYDIYSYSIRSPASFTWIHKCGLQYASIPLELVPKDA